MFTRATVLVAPETKQNNPTHTLTAYFLKFKSVQHVHLSHCLPSRFFTSGCSDQILHSFLNYTMRATCPTNLNRCDIYKINNDCRAKETILYNFLYSHVILPLSLSLSAERYSLTVSTCIILIIKRNGKTESICVSISGF